MRTWLTAAVLVAAAVTGPPALAEPPVTGNCEVADVNDSEFDRLLVVVVHAESTELLALTAACTVTSARGTATIRTELFGPVVAGAGEVQVPHGPVEVCLTIWNGLWYGRQQVLEPPCRTL